ncbi:hypothetical protein BCR42DRAFT_466685 [Absidia repens]|uniref:CoA-binding domain-containing protein n=1 Tax=Absidia repens TaxID=90262 RepID=A0A1X2IE22_9FUNG|nr:hypothetical protein BCR42DRAFT_466685 [Absidia repens]
MSLTKRFITSCRFVVVGASTSRAKYGNKVLRWYQSECLNVAPVHPVETEIEGIRCITSVDQLEDPKNVLVYASECHLTSTNGL